MVNPRTSHKTRISSVLRGFEHDKKMLSHYSILYNYDLYMNTDWDELYRKNTKEFYQV